MYREGEERVRVWAGKEWESDIKHQGANRANSPAHSFFFHCRSPSTPPIHLPLSLSVFLSVSLYHVFLLSPPTPLISSKSSYISHSVHRPPLPHCLPSPTLAKKNQVDLNEQMKRGGERLHPGSPGKAGSALSGSAFVYSGLPHVKLSEVFFALFLPSSEAKPLGIGIIWSFLIFFFPALFRRKGG